MRFFSEYKKQILIVVAIALSVTAIATAGKKIKATPIENGLAFVVVPLQEVSTNVSNWFDSKFADAKSEQELKAENEELAAKVAMLELENKRLALYEKENEKLTELLHIAQKYPEYETTAATIIGKDTSNWYNIFTINKGSDDGVNANMILMDSGGVVGKVIEVGKNYAKCQTILDNRSSVSAMSSRTEDLGIVRGDYTLMDEGLCKMEYINAESQITIGDEIITSYLSDIYPVGLPLGTIKEIVTDSNGLTKYAIVETQVDFDHLSTVLVITDPLAAKEGVE